MKATAEELRNKFDGDVERFSDLDRGHVAAMDSPLAMELIASAALAVTPHARRALDVGCATGALLDSLRASGWRSRYSIRLSMFSMTKR